MEEEVVKWCISSIKIKALEKSVGGVVFFPEKEMVDTCTPHILLACQSNKTNKCQYSDLFWVHNTYAFHLCWGHKDSFQTISKLLHNCRPSKPIWHFNTVWLHVFHSSLGSYIAFTEYCMHAIGLGLLCQWRNSWIQFQHKGIVMLTVFFDLLPTSRWHQASLITWMTAVQIGHGLGGLEVRWVPTIAMTWFMVLRYRQVGVNLQVQFQCLYNLKKYRKYQVDCTFVWRLIFKKEQMTFIN